MWKPIIFYLACSVIFISILLGIDYYYHCLTTILWIGALWYTSSSLLWAVLFYTIELMLRK